MMDQTTPNSTSRLTFHFSDQAASRVGNMQEAWGRESATCWEHSLALDLLCFGCFAGGASLPWVPSLWPCLVLRILSSQCGKDGRVASDVSAKRCLIFLIEDMTVHQTTLGCCRDRREELSERGKAASAPGDKRRAGRAPAELSVDVVFWVRHSKARPSTADLCVWPARFRRGFAQNGFFHKTDMSWGLEV